MDALLGDMQWRDQYLRNYTVCVGEDDCSIRIDDADSNENRGGSPVKSQDDADVLESVALFNLSCSFFDYLFSRSCLSFR